MSAYTELTPIIVLTGFLGSGKTTLLNRLLKHPALGDAAVLINEFGEVGIDHQLVEAVDESTVLLSSGCLCCTIRDDLKQAILEVHDKRSRGLVPPYRRMIVETTGLADPAPILATLMNDVSLRHHYRLARTSQTLERNCDCRWGFCVWFGDGQDCGRVAGSRRASAPAVWRLGCLVLCLCC